MANFAANLSSAVTTCRQATDHLVTVAASDPTSLLGASSPYLRLLGTTVCAGLLGGAALKVDADTPFGASKVAAARFFGEQILPAAEGLSGAVHATSEDLFAIAADAF